MPLTGCCVINHYIHSKQIQINCSDSEPTVRTCFYSSWLWAQFVILEIFWWSYVHFKVNLSCLIIPHHNGEGECFDLKDRHFLRVVVGQRYKQDQCRIRYQWMHDCLWLFWPAPPVHTTQQVSACLEKKTRLKGRLISRGDREKKFNLASLFPQSSQLSQQNYQKHARVRPFTDPKGRCEGAPAPWTSGAALCAMKKLWEEARDSLCRRGGILLCSPVTFRVVPEGQVRLEKRAPNQP